MSSPRGRGKMTDMDQPSVRYRRWLQFSLRTFLVAISVLCVWLGIKVNAARRQKAAVAAIIKSGGELCFDYQWVPDPTGKSSALQWDPNAEPPAPLWLRTLLDEECFRTVTHVDFIDCEVSEANFAQIAKL